MARVSGTEIRMRLVVEAPVPGLLYSLQQDDAPFDARASAAGEPLAFDFPARVANGKFLGDFVRREGKERRFVYLRVGRMAGDGAAVFGGRIKVDVHDIPVPLIEDAMEGAMVEGRLAGSRDGKAVLASVKPVWRSLRP